MFVFFKKKIKTIFILKASGWVLVVNDFYLNPKP